MNEVINHKTREQWKSRYGFRTSTHKQWKFGRQNIDICLAITTVTAYQWWQSSCLCVHTFPLRVRPLPMPSAIYGFVANKFTQTTQKLYRNIIIILSVYNLTCFQSTRSDWIITATRKHDVESWLSCVRVDVYTLGTAWSNTLDKVMTIFSCRH